MALGAGFVLASLWALVVAMVQFWVTDHPNLTLLFDSQGYVFVAESLSRAFAHPGIAGELSSWVLHAFAEDIRLNLSSRLTDLAEISKTGPVVPGIVWLGLALSGKTAAGANWPVAALSMMVVSALTVGTVWLWARLAWGRWTALTSAVVLSLHPGFIVNSARPLSELPGALFLVCSLALFHATCLRKSAAGPSSWALPACAGASFGLLMLSRPTFLPLPLILVAGAAIMARFTGLGSLLRPRATAAMCAGMLAVLAPWGACKYLLTGTPSLTVDRYGSWNLYTGLNLQDDGWDVLPSQFVSHPDRFRMPLPEAVKAGATAIKENPGQAAWLALRKPARMIASPWNDFQVTALALPWTVQRFLHQALVLAALAGFLVWFAQARAGKDDFARSRLPLWLLSAAVLYHLVSCLFITMNRYFATAIPLMVLLAAAGLRHVPANRRAVTALGIILAPGVSALLFLVEGSEFHSGLLQLSGRLPLALAAATLLGGATLASILLLCPKAVTRLAAASAVLVCVPVVVSCCFKSWSEAPCSFHLTKEQPLEMRCRVSSPDAPAGFAGGSGVKSRISSDLCFLVMDGPVCHDHSIGAGQPRCFDAAIQDHLRVAINGKALSTRWLPLWAVDSSQRENLTYLSAFAYSSGKETSNFRQWLVLPLASGMVQDGENQVKLSWTGASRLPVPADIVDADGMTVTTPSLRRFSWSKGFFADSPGEMRCLERQRLPIQAALPPGTVLPRIFLLRAASEPQQSPVAPIRAWPGSPAESTFASAARRQAVRQPWGEQAATRPESVPEAGHGRDARGQAAIIELPDQHVGSKASERVRFVNIEGSRLLDAQSAGASGLLITLSGRCRGPGSPSVAIVERLSRKEEFAPLSPQRLIDRSLPGRAGQATGSWRQFLISDLLPLDQDGKSSRLKELSLLFTARPWWDVLAYAVYKGSAAVDFASLKLVVEPAPTMDLDRQRWAADRLYPVEPARGLACRQACVKE